MAWGLDLTIGAAGVRPSAAPEKQLPSRPRANPQTTASKNG